MNCQANKNQYKKKQRQTCASDAFQSLPEVSHLSKIIFSMINIKEKAILLVGFYRKNMQSNSPASKVLKSYFAL